MIRRHPVSFVVVVWAGLGLLWTVQALAADRLTPTDWELAARSDLIVVGHIQRGSIKLHNPENIEGLHGHTATLVITEVLKGQAKPKEIPLYMYSWFLPVVGGHLEEQGHVLDLRQDQKDYPADIIEILSTADDLTLPLVKDAGEDNVWLLRRLPETYGKLATDGGFFLLDPEELRPLALKDYLAAYLAKDPENAVRDYAAKHPDLPGVKDAVPWFLDHCEIERLRKVADVKERVRRLLPFYVEHKRGSFWEARDALLACGPEAGTALLTVFEDPKVKDFRSDIIEMWRRLKYDSCVDTLIELLKRQEVYWAGRKLQKGWFSKLTLEDKRNYWEIYEALDTLYDIGDPRAREAVELTLRRWQEISDENTPIHEKCTAALKAFDAKAGPAVK